MKEIKANIRKSVFTLIGTFYFLFAAPAAIFAQYPGIDDDIAKHRKGLLIVKAKSGDKISVEQMRHEFWFGCAISNGMAGGSWPEEDIRQYKEHFLKNFNSAVTENAVKWASMEPRKDEVNYKVVDAILKWTEENDIPLRAHNLYWGIPKFVQPWLKELSDEALKRPCNAGEKRLPHDTRDGLQNTISTTR